MRIHVSLADPGREEWLPLAAVSGSSGHTFGVLQQYDSEISLPGGERMRVRGVYDPDYRSVSIAMLVGDRQVFELSGWKRADDGYDPSGSFLTPEGNYVQVLFGT